MAGVGKSYAFLPIHERYAFLEKVGMAFIHRYDQGGEAIFQDKHFCFVICTPCCLPGLLLSDHSWVVNMNDRETESFLIVAAKQVAMTYEARVIKDLVV